MVIVNKQNVLQIISIINAAPNIAIDTETTGLKPYLGDRLFSIIVSTDEEDYYFNFNDNGPTLDRSVIRSIINPDYKGRIFFHNAKFDLKMLELDGLNLKGHRIYDTAGLARLEYNDRMQLSLASLASLVGQKKQGDIIDDYIKDNKLFTKENNKKNKHFDQVPFDLMSEYGSMDGNITLKLGKKLLKLIISQDENKKVESSHSLIDVLKTENKLTPILMDMQDTGLHLDRDFTKEALEYERENYQRLAKRYTEISGISFKDSNKNHAIAFTAVGEKFPLTEKGNPSFNDEVLKSMDSDLARVIREYRTSYKKAHTYFENFLSIADHTDTIHANLNQYQARTGRFSSSEPNLQNLNRGRDGEKFPVRGAFTVAPQFDFIAFLDHDQFEYRMMLNKAGEMGIIEQVLAGLDVHTATANMMEVPRQQAKTINFLLLYGGGIAVLARALFSTHLSEHTLKEIQKYKFFKEFKWTLNHIADELKLELWEVEHGVEILTKARDLKELYFSKLPAVKNWVNKVVSQAERGIIYNDLGRAYRFNKNFAFKAPNYLIQGETADFLKRSMVDIQLNIKPYDSKMLLQVHDELQFGMIDREKDLLFKIKDIMEFNPVKEHLPYTVGIDITDTSWANKRSYDEYYKERN